MVDTIELVRVAVAAERLRWRLLARRTLVRSCLLVACLVFLCAAVVMAHVLVLAGLEPQLGPRWAAAMVLAGDLCIALVLSLLASRLGPGADERAARDVVARVRGEMARRTRLLGMAGSILALLRR